MEGRKCNFSNSERVYRLGEGIEWLETHHKKGMHHGSSNCNGKKLPSEHKGGARLRSDPRFAPGFDHWLGPLACAMDRRYAGSPALRPPGRLFAHGNRVI